MVIELLSDFLLGTSAFYFYISLLISAIAVLKIVHIDIHRYIHHHINSKQAHTIDIQVPCVINLKEEISVIRNWIAQKVKRMESPDDDTDGHPRKRNMLQTTYWGGISWKINNLYSHSLKNTALSQSFSLFY